MFEDIFSTTAACILNIFCFAYGVLSRIAFLPLSWTIVLDNLVVSIIKANFCDRWNSKTVQKVDTRRRKRKMAYSLRIKRPRDSYKNLLLIDRLSALVTICKISSLFVRILLTYIFCSSLAWSMCTYYCSLSSELEYLLHLTFTIFGYIWLIQYHFDNLGNNFSLLI